jgi:hypothetical protein
MANLQRNTSYKKQQKNQDGESAERRMGGIVSNVLGKRFSIWRSKKGSTYLGDVCEPRTGRSLRHLSTTRSTTSFTPRHTLEILDLIEKELALIVEMLGLYAKVFMGSV